MSPHLSAPGITPIRAGPAEQSVHVLVVTQDAPLLHLRDAVAVFAHEKLNGV
jgi:hypothetical protein